MMDGRSKFPWGIVVGLIGLGGLLCFLALLDPGKDHRDRQAAFLAEGPPHRVRVMEGGVIVEHRTAGNTEASSGGFLLFRDAATGRLVRIRAAHVVDEQLLPQEVVK
jgi:hypothetical protein